jgi:hypothetical protein
VKARIRACVLSALSLSCERAAPGARVALIGAIDADPPSVQMVLSGDGALTLFDVRSSKLTAPGGALAAGRADVRQDDRAVAGEAMEILLSSIVRPITSRVIACNRAGRSPRQ